MIQNFVFKIFLIAIGKHIGGSKKEKYYITNCILENN